MELSEKVKLVVNCYDNKKAENIVAMEVGELTSVADYFVIGSAQSSSQVKAIADEIEEKMEKAGFTAVHREGYNGAMWILLDYSDIVCHIFNTETRGFYDIERLWSDAKKLDVEKLIQREDKDLGKI